MDVAYDKVQDDALSPVDQEQHKKQQELQQGDGEDTESQRERSRSVNLQDELRDTYKALSESTWGAKLGGFFSSVKQQGGSYYERAGQELSNARTGASKGFSDLLSQTRNISLAQLNADISASRGNTSNIDPTISLPDTASETTAIGEESKDVPAKQPESLPADIYREAQSIFSSFRSSAAATASTRIEQIQRAEDAADEALLKFGANLRNLLRDAVTITAPTDADQLENDPRVKRSLLFESKDADGRRVVHATRFDAQLHVIHTTETSFTADPTDTSEFDSWKATFDAEKKTDEIAADLEKYPELRRVMERLVPEKVDYANFWRRYYFLKHAIETEERKRRELLKGTALDNEEEVGWDDDEDDDDEVAGRAPTPTKKSLAPTSNEAAPRPSTDTITGSNSSNDLLKPNEPRRSNEHSVADSDASYDIVSGAPSRGPDSPKESEKKKLGGKPAAEESDEEDWE